jgi:hypothetical protein
VTLNVMVWRIHFSEDDLHHTGSAVFACPPGLRPGQHWGDTLFT